VDVVEVRCPGEKPVERVGRQPAPQENLDVLDRLIGEARISSRSRER
jgi:hypothetical protein